MGHTDGRAPDGSELFVTAGASHALDLVSAVLLRPDDTVVVDSPTYHLALRIIADHVRNIVPAPTDQDGIDPGGTGRLVRRLHGEGRRVPMLYLVPTFGNPSGQCLSLQRRTELVRMAQRTGTIVVEDDTYRELAYDGTPPLSLWSIAEGDGL
jgi:DNA-binding transcriptional MocR family regulator